MREKYWSMYTEIKHKERYYWHYQNGAKRLNAVINAICVIASASSIAGWNIWTNVPVLWCVIIGTAQLLQVLKPLFPFSQQLVGFRFLLPSLTSLLTEIDHEWDKVTFMDDRNATEISSMMYNRNKEFDSLENQFLGDTYCPLSSRCDKKAEQDCNAFFKHRYHVCITEE